MYRWIKAISKVLGLGGFMVFAMCVLLNALFAQGPDRRHGKTSVNLDSWFVGSMVAMVVGFAGALFVEFKTPLEKPPAQFPPDQQFQAPNVSRKRRRRKR